MIHSAVNDKQNTTGWPTVNVNLQSLTDKHIHIHTLLQT